MEEDYAAAQRYATNGLSFIGPFPDLEMELLTLKSSGQSKVGDIQARETARIIQTKIDAKGISPISLRVGLHAIARVESVLHSGKAWRQSFEIAKSEIMLPGGGCKDPYTGLLLISGEIKAMKDLHQFDEKHLEKLVEQANFVAGQQLERLRQEIVTTAEQVRLHFETTNKR